MSLRKMIVLLTVYFIISCNAISLNNVSNDFKWKNKKFKNGEQIALSFSPKIIDSINNSSPFFDKIDVNRIEQEFDIKKTLEVKLKKRNILLKEENLLKLSVDSLLFKSYSEEVSVYSNSETEYMGTSNKDYFVFKIYGKISYNNQKIKEVFAEKEHNTEPRESFIISSVIVHDGINARSDRMIENTINEFSYEAYKVIKTYINKEK